jgi:hypothetical protein
MPAKVPPDQIALPKRHLRELPVGGECKICFVDLRVDKEGFAFLDPDATIEAREGDDLITVKRDEAGYHVNTFRRRGIPDFKFPPKPSFMTAPFKRYYPVESFSQDGDPGGIDPRHVE